MEPLTCSADVAWASSSMLDTWDARLHLHAGRAVRIVVYMAPLLRSFPCLLMPWSPSVRAPGIHEGPRLRSCPSPGPVRCIAPNRRLPAACLTRRPNLPWLPVTRIV